ncbi:MAG: NAD(P)/FAD-dependent oxidoreductase [Actinomycetota bacterium]|nr:NAD(P)/FAD-dependent oxidoreductase [Actinomycetota bacterium]
MYDAIIVGARCGGSPTAMLLAREGYRVLLVDRATFPSDTLSTHFIQQSGVALLARWGLLDAVLSNGLEPVTRATIGTYEGGQPIDIPEVPGVPGVVAPRRTRLDKLLLDAAVEAGAEFRDRFTFEDVILDDGRVVGISGRDSSRSGIEERARIVIGADGRHSTFADKVGAEMRDYVAPLTCGYYSYWSGFEHQGVETYFGDRGVTILFPTDDEMTVLIGLRPVHRFDEMRRDVQGAYVETLREAPGVAERLDAATCEERILGGKDVPNFFRACSGSGWALVGDAAYHKDPTPADGITDAFLGVDLLVDALDSAFSEDRSQEEALADYEAKRDEIARPHYDMCLKISSFEVPAEQRAALFLEHAAARYMQGLEVMGAGG